MVECDSTATAASIYQQCDGLVRLLAGCARARMADAELASPLSQEFERSSTRLDLRFIPDEQSFAARVVRDTATEVRL